MKRLLLLLMLIGVYSNVFAMTEAERKTHYYDLKHNFETHESLYIYTDRPLDIKVEVKRKELKKGVNSSTLTKLEWSRKKSWTNDKLVSKKENAGKTFQTQDRGGVFSDYYAEIRVPYRRYLLTQDFINALKKYDFEMEIAAAEFAVAVAAEVTAFVCPEVSELAENVAKKAAKKGAKEAFTAVKDFRPYRKNMEKANKNNYDLTHYYYIITVDEQEALVSQSLIDYYQGAIYFDSASKTFTLGPKGKPYL
ncbi:MAG: hypothetical protein C0618_07480 [Desulfuromonas sp.]|nr:MAG: hypothetical protein C0618_07480 [Desulfuromonas sp.]